MISLMMAVGVSERREILVIDENRTSDHLRKLLDVPPEPLDLHIAEALDKAAAAIEASKLEYEAVPWDANWKPTRGRVVSQARGPNRAQRRGR